MNQLNGNILVGSKFSQARFDNAKVYCLECLRHPNIKINLWNNRMPTCKQDLFCEVCEEVKKHTYIID